MSAPKAFKVKTEQTSREPNSTPITRFITKGETYGSYMVVKKLEDKLYGCTCVHCSTKSKFKAAELRKEPNCECQKNLPAVTKPVSEKQLARTKNREEKVERNLQEIQSLFGEDSEAIKDLLNIGDTERATTQFQRKILATLVDIIPIAEAKYRETRAEHAAYALNGIISQARELIADIQANDQSSQLATKILVSIIQPIFMGIMQNSVDNLYYLKKSIESELKPGKAQEVNSKIDDSAKEIGRYLEDSYNAIRMQLQQELSS